MAGAPSSEGGIQAELPLDLKAAVAQENLPDFIYEIAEAYSDPLCRTFIHESTVDAIEHLYQVTRGQEKDEAEQVRL